MKNVTSAVASALIVLSAVSAQAKATPAAPAEKPGTGYRIFWIDAETHRRVGHGECMAITKKEALDMAAKRNHHPDYMFGYEQCQL